MVSIFILFVLLVSFIGAVCLLVYVFGQRKKRESGELSPGSSNEKSGGGTVWCFVFLMFVGLVFLCAGMIPAMNSYEREMNWDKVSAVVTHSHKRPSNHGTLRVSYEYKGTVYEDVDMNFYSNLIWEGETISILVNPDIPSQIANDWNTLIPLYGIMIAVGSVLCLLALYICIRRRFRKESEDELRVSRSEEEEQRNRKRTDMGVRIFIICFTGVWFYMMWKGGGVVGAGAGLIVMASMFYCKIKGEKQKREKKEKDGGSA